MRPTSIKRYEICYLGSVLLGAVNEAMNWKVTNSPQAQAALGAGFMPVFIVFVYTLSMILWYFTARSASLVAKWAVVAFFAASVIGFFAVLAMGTVPLDLPGLLRIAGLGLNAVAVGLLFRPDSRAWFGEKA